MKSPKFEYVIGIEKRGTNIRATSFNSPYDNINKAKDDIEVILHGKDLNGNILTEYKTVFLENEEDGYYWVKVLVRYYPHDDNTFDQIFILNEIQKGKKHKKPF